MAGNPYLIATERDRSEGGVWETTPAEVEVFGLDADLIPQLIDAQSRYERMVGIERPNTDEEREQAERDRQAYPDYLTRPGESGRPALDERLAALFMHHVCGLPYAQAHAWQRKCEMAEWRLGLINVT